MATVTNEVLRIQFKGLGFHYEEQGTSPQSLMYELICRWFSLQHIFMSFQAR